MANKRERILIINVLGLGDIARNTSLLIPLKKKYNPCHITWLTGKIGSEMLKNNPFVDEVLIYEEMVMQDLPNHHYHLIISPEQVPRIAELANRFNADVKLGFGVNQDGDIIPLNAESHYAYKLGIDDDLKFRHNKRTYQDVLFESMLLDYSRNEYCLTIEDKHRHAAAELLLRLGIKQNEIIIGINIGYGIRFPNKMWDTNSCIAFVKRLAEQVPCKILLLGGNREHNKLIAISHGCPENLYWIDTSDSIQQFQAFIGKCNLLVTGDSLGMHLAIAEKRKVVAIFGPTCANEIEFYDRGEAIVSQINCSPCYKWKCDLKVNCMDHIDHEKVISTVKKYIIA